MTGSWLVLFGSALLAPPALASGWHSGVPIEAVQALHLEDGAQPTPASFGTAATGWSLIVPDGIVFVYVAPSAEQMTAWLELQLSRQRVPPVPVLQPVTGVDAAWRRETDFALIRDGNVGIMVQGTAEATEEAALVRSLIRDDGPPWPGTPRWSPQSDGTWTVDAPDALHIAWQGGRRVQGPGLRFSALPDKLVVWDAWGRAAVAHPTQAPDSSPPDEGAPPR